MMYYLYFPCIFLQGDNRHEAAASSGLAAGTGRWAKDQPATEIIRQEGEAAHVSQSRGSCYR